MAQEIETRFCDLCFTLALCAWCEDDKGDEWRCPGCVSGKGIFAKMNARRTGSETERVMAEDWNNCRHVWKPVADSQFDSEIQQTVVCKKCGCHGAKDVRTDEVFWPAT